MKCKDICLICTILIQVVCRSVNIFERLCKASTRHTCKVDAKQNLGLPSRDPITRKEVFVIKASQETYFM